MTRLTAELNPRFRQSQRHAQAALFERDIRQPVDLRIESLSVAATPEQKGKPRRATVSFRIVNHGKEAVTTPFRTSVFPGDTDPKTRALQPFVFTSSGLAPGKSIYGSRSVVLPDEVHEFNAEVRVDVDRAIKSPSGHPAATAHFQNPVPDVGRWYTIGPDRIGHAASQATSRPISGTPTARPRPAVCEISKAARTIGRNKSRAKHAGRDRR